MEDRSVVAPIISSLEYFQDSKVELDYFYKVIDKFCAKWFGSFVHITKLDLVDIYLIHELLAEYLRFEENNKRIALWLLAINRVCSNFNADLSSSIKEIESLYNIVDETTDNSLIEPILNSLTNLEDRHNKAGDTRGKEDVIGSFLQWVGLYTTYIYPNLENKSNFYDKKILRAMNFLLSEFIQQRSNDKRLAFLIFAIHEGCKQYSLQVQSIDTITNESFEDKHEHVFAGHEENLVEELLNKLKQEKDKVKPKRSFSIELLTDTKFYENFTRFINQLNSDPDEAVVNFNKFTFNTAGDFLSFDNANKFLFLQNLNRYGSKKQVKLSDETYTAINKSFLMLSPKTIKWFEDELKKIYEKKDAYIEFIIRKLDNENVETRINSAKLYVMVYLVKIFNLLQK